MFSQSLTLYCIKHVWAFFVKTVKESFFVITILKFFDWISKVVKESFLYSWLGKDVFTKKYYESSYSYKVLNLFWQWILKIVKKLQVLTRRVFKDSLTLCLFDKVFTEGLVTIDVILALFLGGILIVPHTMWNNLYFVIAAFVFFMWIVIRTAAGKVKENNVTIISVSMLAFIVAIILSTINALVLSDAIKFALFLLSSVIIAYTIYLSLDTKEKFVRFINIILVFVTITALYAIYQRIRGVEINLEFVDIYENKGMPGRVYSTFLNPNNYAQLLVLFMPFFVPAFLFCKKKLYKPLILLGFVLSFVALAMTYSRSCWVGIALAAVVFVCIYDKRLIIPMAFLVVLAIPFLPETIMNRIFTIGSMQDSSNSYRLYIWDSCLRMIKDFGLTGLGLGPASFKVMYPGYASPVALTAPHSHMLYMQIILEMGIMGFVSFFAYILSLSKKAAGSMRIMAKNTKCYTSAALSALAGIAFVCAAEYIWFYPRIMFAFWVIPGILMTLIKIAKNDKEFERV